MWEVDTEKCLRTLEGHTRLIVSVVFSPNCRFALSASRDNTINFWEFDWENEYDPNCDPNLKRRRREDAIKSAKTKLRFAEAGPRPDDGRALSGPTIVEEADSSENGLVQQIGTLQAVREIEAKKYATIYKQIRNSVDGGLHQQNVSLLLSCYVDETMTDLCKFKGLRVFWDSTPAGMEELVRDQEFDIALELPPQSNQYPLRDIVLKYRKKTKIILCLRQEAMPSEFEFRRAGFHAVIAAPFDLPQLLNKINELMG
jgi:hypothetical protein